MLDRESQIKELYDIKHKHDSNINAGYDYDKDLLRKTLSPVLFKNDNLATYLDQLQKLVVIRFDAVAMIRNKFNHIVGRYYNKYNK